MNIVIKKILNKLEKNGFTSYVVGGYVRDYLRNIESFDVDIATNAQPIDLKNIFKEGKYEEKYGSLKLKINNFYINITPFRKEECINNKIEISYNETLENDALRRDFTINVLYMDKHEFIKSPLNGLEDLKQKEIRVIGNISRVTEDPIRMLRAIRFKYQLNFNLDTNLITYIKEQKHLVKNISYFKKKEELNKMLSLPNSLECLSFLKEINILEDLEINYSTINFTSNVLGMWAQLEVSSNYSFTKEEMKTINSLREYKEINNYSMYKLGLNLSITLTEILGGNPKETIKCYKCLPLKPSSSLKINYNDLHKLGYKDNEISDIIKDIKKQILSNNLKNNKKSIIEFLNNHNRR